MLGYVWDIPFGSSLTGFTGALLRDWQLSGLGIFNSGSPIFINQDGDTLNVDSEEIRPNVVCRPGPDTAEATSGRSARWFNTGAFARATVTYGTSIPQPRRRARPQGRGSLAREGVPPAAGPPGAVQDRGDSTRSTG